jgi:hypothetical protein
LSHFKKTTSWPYFVYKPSFINFLERRDLMKKLFLVLLSMTLLVMAVSSVEANDNIPFGKLVSAVSKQMPVLPPQGFIHKDHNEYAFWFTVGKRAGEEALELMESKGVRPFGWNLIVMSNAGYSEIEGSTTMGSLDGLAYVTGVSRGSNSLLEIHSNSEKPLYFALFDSKSGLCAYLQVNPDFNMQCLMFGQYCHSPSLSDTALVSGETLRRTAI